MKEFQQKVNTALSEMFDLTTQEQQEIEQIAKQAAQLRSTLNQQDNKVLDLTVELIVNKMEERADGGPKWAWNNWIKTLESFNVIPEGHQI